MQSIYLKSTPAKPSAPAVLFSTCTHTWNDMSCHIIRKDKINGGVISTLAVYDRLGVMVTVHFREGGKIKRKKIRPSIILSLYVLWTDSSIVSDDEDDGIDVETKSNILLPLKLGPVNIPLDPSISQTLHMSLGAVNDLYNVVFTTQTVKDKKELKI